MLEEGDFRGRTANFVFMLLFGIINMTFFASWAELNFLGSALTFMMVYIWYVSKHVYECVYQSYPSLCVAHNLNLFLLSLGDDEMKM